MMKEILPASSFQKILLRWFDAHGRKDLPWQKDKTPYRVWISEIMLQQTQVNTVIPYFERFMQKFPDIETLAKSDLDVVLHFWAGLGYYHRAKHLYSASKKIFFEFSNQFPNDMIDILKLPGVGRSTAGAIFTIAFGKKAPILDGNVKRVLSRLHAIETADADPILWNLAEIYSPKKRCGDFTQAIMDLGATLCIRGKPHCNRCPFQKNCLAHAKGIEKDLPVKKPRKTLPIRTATFLILRQGKKILLKKKPNKGIWSGLFSFPEISDMATKKNITELCVKEFQAKLKDMTFGKCFRHTFTHFHLDIHPVLIDLHSHKIVEENGFFWYHLQKTHRIGLPAPVQSLLDTLKTHDTIHLLQKTQKKCRSIGSPSLSRRIRSKNTQ